jgi:acetoin utilization protein AcuC
LAESNGEAVFVGEALGRYAFGGGHPFGPDRLDAFWHEAGRRGLDRRVRTMAPVEAAEDVIARFHTPAYVARVKRLSERGGGMLDMGDTPAFPGVFEAAATVVGSALAGAEGILRGDWRRCFVPVAGLHHARRDSASGFCVFNDCGVVIETLKAIHGLERIAYVDIDAHHGDGVYYGFEDDPAVWTADLHQDGHTLFPGTGDADERGRGQARGTKLNIPLAPGADDRAFHHVWPRVEAHLEAAQPQFILFQCGADSLAGDPLAGLAFSWHAHAHAAQRLRQLAEGSCNGRLLAVGGGGYNRANLAAAWCAVVEALAAD